MDENLYEANKFPAILMCDECFDIDAVDHLKADERYKTSMVLVKSGIAEPLDYFAIAVVEYHSESIRSAQTYLRN